MKLSKFLKLIGISSIVLILISVVIFAFIIATDPSGKLEYVRTEVDLIKIIIGGFFVSVAVVILPQIFQERKYEFEMRTEAKKLYSEVKTFSIYFPYLFSGEDDVIKIIEKLKEFHQKKHLAETYSKYLRKRGQSVEVEKRIWKDEHLLWKKFNEMTTIIEEKYSDWKSMSSNERLKLLKERMKN